LTLIEKIGRKEARIAIIGLGHVGLITATIFAEADFSVVGVDAKPDVVKNVSSGKNYLEEPGLDDLLKKAVGKGKLEATIDAIEAVKTTDIHLICVQTPVSGDKKPNLTYIEDACKTVAQGLSRGNLVVVGSTVPPGTTNGVVARVLGESELECGRDFWLAHCPERLTVGKALEDFVETSRIVGGYNAESTEVAAELYKAVTKGKILTTDCTSAEMAKLAENAFRYVNIAFANELALICERRSIDAMEVIRLANTHPRVSVHKPGSGVGGPCLPKDTHLLLHTAKKSGLGSKVIKCSIELNESMPMHMIELAVKAVKMVGKHIKDSRIVVLGSTYKGEVSDARDSPSKQIVHALLNLGADVVVYDPYCEETFGAKKAKGLLEAVSEADCLVIATDHQMFRQLELGKIKRLINENAIIVDGRRVVNPREAKKHGFRYLGIGYQG
jgi:UDP-N-acetyl-D-mannosaminuronic acid dehydrogenase